MIDCFLTADERISLITTIFSDRDEVEIVKDLQGDDAQSFVNVIDEVLRPFISEVSRSFDSDFPNPVDIGCSNTTASKEVSEHFV